jgi:hypothetical protein
VIAMQKDCKNVQIEKLAHMEICAKPFPDL